MEAQVNLYTFLNVNFLLKKRLINALREVQGLKISIAPANDTAEWLLKEIHRRGLKYESIHIYDKNTKKDFPADINDYIDVSEHNADRSYIVSARLAGVIHDRFLSSGVPEHSIINMAETVPLLQPCYKALEYIYAAKDTESINLLHREFREDDLIIINCPGFFYDIYDKLRIFRNNLDAGIVWIDNVMNPVTDTSLGVVRANMIDVINYLDSRQRNDNVVFFSLNSAWHLVIPYLMREAFDEVKIIIYMYEWLNFHFPYEHKEIFQSFTGMPAEYVEGEYFIYNQILDGDIIDGLIYKHGGESFKILDQYPKPRLYYPTYISKKLYQPLPDEISVIDKFVFLGALPSVMEEFELFERAHVIDAFSELLNQGFEIDIYEPRSNEVINEYRKYFKSDNIRFISGKPLDLILPEISGKYQWGFMAFDHSNIKICREHIEVALPAKIYSYLALGVPIVITEEIKFAAGIVRDNGIGVVIPSRDISGLRTILNNADYRQLQKNIIRFRESVCLENHETELVDFMNIFLKGDNEN